MSLGRNVRKSLFLLGLTLTSPSVWAAEACSREWALEKISGKSFRIVGLGLSTRTDPKAAVDEARAAAFKDISLQLQSSVQSRSEIKESQSESTFSANSILTSNSEELVGLKSVKSGKNPQEKITACEVYEFNVQAAYQDQSSQLSVVQEKIDKLNELGEKAQWRQVIREYPEVQPLVAKYATITKRADLFKAYLNVPGPAWNERFEKGQSQLADLEKKSRSKIVFVFPKEQFSSVVAEVEGLVTNAGANVASDAKEIKGDQLGIEVAIVAMGNPRSSKTRLGLTVTRKVSISLTDIKTKKKLAAGNGLSVVGTSMSGDEEEATANSENQLIGALTDAIKNAVPNLIKG